MVFTPLGSVIPHFLILKADTAQKHHYLHKHIRPLKEQLFQKVFNWQCHQNYIVIAQEPDNLSGIRFYKHGCDTR